MVHATELLTVARHEYEKGVEEQQQSEARFKSLQQEILQARKLDIQLDTAIRDLSHSEQQLKNVMLRKEEAEKKYQAAVLRRRQGAEEIARLTAWRERYKRRNVLRSNFQLCCCTWMQHRPPVQGWRRLSVRSKRSGRRWRR